MILRDATAADFPFIRALTGDPGNAPFISDEDEAALALYLAAPDSRLLIAETDGEPAGFALFCGLSDPSGSVELRRLALVRAGGGRGRPFIAALLAHAFADPAVMRIWLDASGENARAMALYEKSGFRREGVLRRHWFRPCLGRVVDLHLFGLLRDEWSAA